MGNPSLLNVAYYRELLKLVDGMASGSKLLTVKNVTGGTLNAGTVVYISGVSNGVPTVAKARANLITTMPSVGILTTNIANNQIGLAQFAGTLERVDTSAFAAGDKLYVSAATAGAITATEPLHPNISQAVAIVLVVSATAGVLFIYPGIDPHGIDQGTMKNEFRIGDGGVLAVARKLTFASSFDVVLQASTASSAIITSPSTTDTLVSRGSTDTLTGKIYEGISLLVSSNGGFNGASLQGPYSLGAAATGSTQSIDLSNNLRSMAIAWGFGSS